MTKLTDGFYLILAPNKLGARNEHGIPTVRGFRASALRRERPATRDGEVAVRLNLTIDSSVFEAVIPVVEVELGEHDTFVNVAVQVVPEPPVEDEEPEEGVDYPEAVTTDWRTISNGQDAPGD
jgi:hypothetical protein